MAEKTKEQYKDDLNNLMAAHKAAGTRPKFEDLIPEHQALIKEALEKNKVFIPAAAPMSHGKGGVK